MKTRTGFVSNSSSSSFIVAFKKNAKVKIEIDLTEFGNTIKTIKQLDEYFKEVMKFSEDKPDETGTIKEQYTQCKKALSEGKKICFGCVSSDSGVAAEIALYVAGIPKTPGIEVILDSNEEQ